MSTSSPLAVARRFCIVWLSAFTQSFSSASMLDLHWPLISPAVPQTAAAPERSALTDLEDRAQSSSLDFTGCSMVLLSLQVIWNEVCRESWPYCIAVNLFLKQSYHVWYRSHPLHTHFTDFRNLIINYVHVTGSGIELNCYCILHFFDTHLVFILPYLVTNLKIRAFIEWLLLI